MRRFLRGFLLFAFGGAIAGKKLAQQFLRGSAAADAREIIFHVVLGDGQVAHDWLASESAEDLERFRGTFEENIAAFGIGTCTAGDLVDPLPIALQINFAPAVGSFGRTFA